MNIPDNYLVVYSEKDDTQPLGIFPSKELAYKFAEAQSYYTDGNAWYSSFHIRITTGLIYCKEHPEYNSNK